MSDYPMLISNKLHSFRNFTRTNIHNLGKMVLVSVEIFFRRMCLVYVKNNMAWRGMAIAWELFGIGEIIVCRIILHHKEQLIACDVEDAPTELMVPRD